MNAQKLELDHLLEEDFVLIAIHYGGEDYKLAFLLNKYLGYHLKKRERDLDLVQKKIPTHYPIFEYVCPADENCYFLVGNTSKNSYQKTTSAGSLFDSETEEKKYFLIPQYRKVDYFFKIIADNPESVASLALSEILKLPNVITAYIVEHNELESRTNLNFD